MYKRLPDHLIFSKYANFYLPWMQHVGCSAHLDSPQQFYLFVNGLDLHYVVYLRYDWLGTVDLMPRTRLHGMPIETGIHKQP